MTKKQLLRNILIPASAVVIAGFAVAIIATTTSCSKEPDSVLISPTGMTQDIMSNPGEACGIEPSSFQTGQDAYKVFDATIDYWASQMSFVYSSLSIDLGKPKTLKSYNFDTIGTIKTTNYNNTAPAHWLILGSSNKSNKLDSVILDEATFQIDPSNGGLQTFHSKTLKNKKAYQYYLMYIAETNGNGYFAAIDELRFFGY